MITWIFPIQCSCSVSSVSVGEAGANLWEHEKICMEREKKSRDTIPLVRVTPSSYVHLLRVMFYSISIAFHGSLARRTDSKSKIIFIILFIILHFLTNRNHQLMKRIKRVIILGNKEQWEPHGSVVPSTCTLAVNSFLNLWKWGAHMAQLNFSLSNAFMDG